MSVSAISAPLHFTTLLKGNTYMVADFYADWCGPCHAIRPMFEKLAQAHAIPGRLAFVKVNVDEQREIAQQYNITAMPTFLFFKDGQPYPAQPAIRGADPQGLGRVIQELGQAAREAQRVDNEKAAAAAEAKKSSSQAGDAAPAPEQKADDGSTVSGGYTLGTTAGKRSDWKMSMRD